MLQKEQDDRFLRPIGYWSRTEKDVERRYDTSHREYLAVVWAVWLLRPYIEESEFTVRTDHQALKWTLDLKERSGRLERWQLVLMKLESDYQHHAGFVYQEVDVLFLLPTAYGCTEAVNDGIPIQCIIHSDNETCLVNSDADA